MRPRLLLLDLDGTLYRGSEPTPGAVDALRRLRAAGFLLRFLTNNSTSTPHNVAAKLQSLGMEASPQEVFTSAQAAARVCRDRGWQRVHVVGEPDLRETLQEHGVSVHEDSPTDAVIVGLDRHATYDTLDRAFQHLRQGAALVATNKDTTYPLEAGRVSPGAGALVAAVEACHGSPAIVAGKPEPTLARLAMESAGVQPHEALLVGDRVDTDIECARRAGTGAALLLTGVAEQPPAGVPAFNTMAELADLLLG